MFGSIGFTELILILVIVLIIFGAGKLPQLGEGVGKAIKGFKKSVHEADAIEAEAQSQAQVVAAPAQPAPIPVQQAGTGTVVETSVADRHTAAVAPTSQA